MLDRLNVVYRSYRVGGSWGGELVFATSVFKTKSVTVFFTGFPLLKYFSKTRK